MGSTPAADLAKKPAVLVDGVGSPHDIVRLFKDAQLHEVSAAGINFADTHQPLS